MGVSKRAGRRRDRHRADQDRCSMRWYRLFLRLRTHVRARQQATRDLRSGLVSRDLTDAIGHTDFDRHLWMHLECTEHGRKRRDAKVRLRQRQTRTLPIAATLALEAQFARPAVQRQRSIDDETIAALNN